MLKKRDLHECHSLYGLMTDPMVFPYVRYPCKSYEEYVFMTQQLIKEEEQGTAISRTILNEIGHPIGTIDLYNIAEQTGFLATWMGASYFGKGYNQRAKESFFVELFLEQHVEKVFMKIRKQNIRSMKAVAKLPYVHLANTTNCEVYQSINSGQHRYDLYQVERTEFLENMAGLRHVVAT
ncbi:GNAT family N-acetyltransferase [Paenibacillus pabuli]|uniref:GNAT family N-acetyltransferase n=1 Tax=Paenibacillus pabuli TaxID=1472 RepID=UPI003CF5AD6F